MDAGSGPRLRRVPTRVDPARARRSGRDTIRAMEWIGYVVAALVTLLGAGSVVLVLLGLPGTWALLAIALLVELIDAWYLPEGARTTFSWWLLAGCTALALLGELFEFLAGALGAKRAGSSRRGQVLAVVGGIAGAIAGAPFGLVIGSFVGAIAGTFLGAVIGEMTRPGMRVEQTFRPASGAVVGRVLGTLSKLPIAVVVWIALSVAAFVR